MANHDRTNCRWMVSSLHIIICMCAGACILTILILRGDSDLECLPETLDITGHRMYKTDGILGMLCEVVLYSCGAISGWNLLSLLVHCCWGSRTCLFLQTLVFFLTSVLGLVGASSLSSQFLLWCTSLQTTFPNATDCQTAANYYDQSLALKADNMFLYYQTSLIQQGCTWVLAFLSLVLAIIYISLLCVATVDPNMIRIRIIRERINEEERPLLPPTDLMKVSEF